MMKNSIGLVVFAAVALVAAQVAPAQVVNENFDSHALGTDMHNLDGWEGWYGDAAVGGFVTDEQANTGNHSLRFTRPVDLAPYWDSITSGNWIMVMMQYVPAAASNGDAYYGVLHSYEKGAAGSAGWITEVISDFATGDVRISGGETARLPLVRDAWAEIKVELDFNAQVATFYYNGGFLGTRDATSLSGLDLWANSNDVMYFDDFWLGTAEMYQTLASRPEPMDGASDAARGVVLRWEPGFYSDRHDVYLGTVFDDVSAADRNNPLGVLVSQGHGDTNYEPDATLEFGQTYYWRIDEVNAAPDNTVFKGITWNFTVEPFAYPVTGITATASSALGDNNGPEKVVDGSGLNVSDGHGASSPDMWLSGSGDPAAWIQFAFDKAYKLHEMWVWNSNQSIESFIGFGVKDVTIEFSADGEAWTTLEGASSFAQAPGTADYEHNTTVAFGGVSARYVRFSIGSAYGFLQQYGLSEVRFYHIPTLATLPNPMAGSIDVAPDLTLSWGRGGREASRHEIYLGTDAGTLSQVGSVSASSFATLPENLGLSQTYYWRVDEVNDAETPSTWVGDVWDFTTADSIVIDDMEGYADAEFLEIWATWVDGFDDPGNGSLVGGTSGTPETSIVHGGGQSLPMSYDNGAAAQSEATRTFDAPMDWTRHGAGALVLYFHGSSENTGGQLYVKINNTKIVYDGDASNLMGLGWNEWTVNFTELAGVDLTRVDSLTVGVDGGGQGVVTIDDIQLTADAR